MSGNRPSLIKDLTLEIPWYWCGCCISRISISEPINWKCECGSTEYFIMNIVTTHKISDDFWRNYHLDESKIRSYKNMLGVETN